MRYYAKNDFKLMYDVPVKKGEQLYKYNGFFRNSEGVSVCPIFSHEANKNIIKIS